MKKITKDQVIRTVKGQSRQPRIRELARILKIPSVEYKGFRLLIKEALSEGKLIKAKGGRLGIPAKKDLIPGKLFVARAGHGFVIPHEGIGDIFINPREMGGAIHGEEVKVVIKSARPGKSRDGRIVEVLNREKGRVVGRIHRGRYGFYVVSDDPRIKDKIEIDNPDKHSIQKDTVVMVRLHPWESPYDSPRGSIEEVLGKAGAPGVDIDSLVVSYGLPREFDARTNKEISHIRSVIPKSEISRRLDLRDTLAFTIDPADAKDHDDAISLEPLNNGRFRLGVHIADVSHYVRPEKFLDKEAMLRGNSVYLVDRVIPMLPEKLSADICSLHENQDRLTLSFIAEIDMEGNVSNPKFVETVIQSKASLNYDDVQAFLDSTGKAKIDKTKGKALKMMFEISRAVRQKRIKKGSLDFDLPAPHVFLDPQGRVLDIISKRRKPSHEIVEEFMLLANKYAAVYLQGLSAPVLYRVHGKPKKEKVEILAGLLKEMGFKFSFKGEVTPKKIQRVIESVKGKPEEQFIEEIVLRTLAKAAYQPENIGHFGLAFDSYTHFTSPIRRYPDLITHRVLKLVLNNKLDAVVAAEIGSRLKSIGDHCTTTEIAADEAGRESVKIKQLEYLNERVGGVYDGIISGVIKAGIFVELTGSMVEGMIPFGSMEDDYFELEEGLHRARGKKSKKVFRLGDKVRIVVVRVDMSERRCDFALVDTGKTKKKSKRKKK